MKLLTAEELLFRVRPLASALIDHKRRETGSKMTAYERVASSVGGSASWLRKLLGRQPNVDLAAHQYMNIVALYRKLCERIEAEAENERRKLEALMDHADAFLDSPLPPASRSAGSPRDRKARHPLY